MVRDISKGRYLLRGHTQACYKDPFTIFTYRGFFFILISVAYNVNKQGKLLHVAVRAQSTSNIVKTIPSCTAIVISQNNSAYSQCVSMYLSTLC